MPARITEPAVGASTWASGSQVCTGHIGIFTAKDAKNASHNHFCVCFGILNSLINTSILVEAAPKLTLL